MAEEANKSPLGGVHATPVNPVEAPLANVNDEVPETTRPEDLGEVHDKPADPAKITVIGNVNKDAVEARDATASIGSVNDQAPAKVTQQEIGNVNK